MRWRLHWAVTDPHGTLAAACGYRGEYAAIKNPLLVTCLRCKRSKAWQQPWIRHEERGEDMTTEAKKVPRGMTEILAVQRAKVCWAVHMLGPDEVIPMASYDAAEKYAVDMNAFFYSGSRDMPDVLCLSVVVPCSCGNERAQHMREAERAAVAGERRSQ